MKYPEYLFVKLGEEASEVIKEAAKCLIFDPDNFAPGTNLRNQEKLVDEIHDFLAQVEMLHENGLINFIYDRSKVDHKKRKVVHYATRMGILQGELRESIDEYDVPLQGLLFP